MYPVAIDGGCDEYTATSLAQGAQRRGRWCWRAVVGTDDVCSCCGCCGRTGLTGEGGVGGSDEVAIAVYDCAAAAAHKLRAVILAAHPADAHRAQRRNALARHALGSPYLVPKLSARGTW